MCDAKPALFRGAHLAEHLAKEESRKGELNKHALDQGAPEKVPQEAVLLQKKKEGNIAREG